MPLFYDESASGGTTGSVPTSEPTSSAAPTSSTQTSTSPSDSTSSVSGAQPEGAASTTTAAPAAQTLFDQFRTEFGWDATQKYKSEGEFRKGLFEAQRLIGQRNQDAEIGRIYGQHLDKFQQFLAQQQNPQAAQQQSEREPYWAPPQWNETWNGWVDGEGQLLENAPMEVRAAFQKRQDFFNQHRHDLVFNFPNRMKPVLEEFKESLIKEVEGRYAQREQQVARTSEANQITERNSPWLYLNDNGRILRDEIGRKLLSPAGQIYLGYLVEAQNIGIQSQSHADTYAQLKTRDHFGMSAPAATNPNPPPAASAPATAMRSPNSNTGRAPNGQFVRKRGGNSLQQRMNEALSREGVEV